MSQSSERSRYRKFVFASAERRVAPSGTTITVTSLRLGRSYRFDPAEFELARLFDGTRDAQAIRAAAAELGNEILPAQLEAFASELAQADLLVAGNDDPLPVPPQTDVEREALGWGAVKPGATPRGGAGVSPPSVAPGALTGAGALRETLTQGHGSKYGRGRFLFTIPVRPFLPLGTLLALPAVIPMGWLAMLIALVVGIFLALGRYQPAIIGSLVPMLHLKPIALLFVFGSLALCFLSKLARATVIARATGEAPRFGLLLAFGIFPWFDVDSNGAAERADLRTRLRVIAAVPLVNLGVAVLGLFLFVLFYRSAAGLAAVSIGMALLSAFYLLLSINPLIKRDGYFLLTTWMKAPDLREQAVMSLFGYWRPWLNNATLPLTALTLYALLCFGYIILVLTLLVLIPGRALAIEWSATGAVVFVFLLTVLLYDSYRRVGSRRGAIGNIKVTPPSTWLWIVGFVVAALSLIPYTFEPSGQFQILPSRQAEARALIDGDIRQVFVKEGDLVKAGDVIVKLNDDQEVAAVARGEAEIDRLQHELALSKLARKPEEVEEARAQVEVARKRYEVSLAESNRIDQAYKRNAVTVQQRDHAVGQTEVDMRAYEQAKAHLAYIASATRDDQLKEIEAQINAAQAQLVYSKQQLAYTEVRAPIEGRILAQNLLNPVGHFAHRGDLIATVQSDKIYAQIQMPEIAIGEIKNGAPITAKAYAYPGTEFAGRVKDIAPAAQLLTTNGQSTSNVTTAESGSNYNVVRVLCEIDDPDSRLKPEMTGYAKVQGRVYPAGGAFFRPVVRLVMVEIWSWLP